MFYRTLHPLPTAAQLKAVAEIAEDEPASHASKSHGEGDGHGGGGHGESNPSIVSNPIPKSIRLRQDGISDPEQDLVEPQPEAQRGLAGLVNTSEFKVEKTYRFYEFPEIMAGTSMQADTPGDVMLKIVVQVDSLEGEKELESRNTEFQSLIASVVSECDRDELLKFEGSSKLKRQIQKEMNHLLLKGKIKDVLLSEFFIR